MSRTIEEQLSALLDGELPSAEEELLLRRLERDAEHRYTLGRYSLIGECLRSADVVPGALDIGDRVRKEVAAQGTFAGSRASRWRGVGRGLLGAGIAAGVAVLALVSLNTLEDRNGSVEAPALARNEIAPVATNPISYTVPANLTRTAVIAPARLTNYLVSHGEYTNALSRQVMDSHIVNHEPERLARDALEDPADE